MEDFTIGENKKFAILYKKLEYVREIRDIWDRLNDSYSRGIPNDIPWEVYDEAHDAAIAKVWELVEIADAELTRCASFMAGEAYEDDLDTFIANVIAEHCEDDLSFLDTKD